MGLLWCAGWERPRPPRWFASGTPIIRFPVTQSQIPTPLFQP